MSRPLHQVVPSAANARAAEREVATEEAVLADVNAAIEVVASWLAESLSACPEVAMPRMRQHAALHLGRLSKQVAMLRSNPAVMAP